MGGIAPPPAPLPPLHTRPEGQSLSTAPNTNPSVGDGYTGMPKWVRWTLIAVLAVVVILVVLRFVVGGNHGPGNHMSAPTPAAAAPQLGP